MTANTKSAVAIKGQRQ